jgi:hypothetical protein
MAVQLSLPLLEYQDVQYFCSKLIKLAGGDFHEPATKVIFLL